MIEFILDEWLLFLAAFIIIAMLVGDSITNFITGVKAITPSIATQMINHESAVMVDVREKKELDEDGFIANSIHIPLGQIESDINKLPKKKDKPVIMVCRTGARSARAAMTVKKHGFENVVNLAGGVEGWKRAELPVSKS